MIHCVSHSTCHWPAHKWMGDIVQYCPYLGEQPPLHLYRVRAHPHNIIGLASVYGVCQHLRHSACCPSMKVWVWHWPQQKILIIVWQMLTDLSRVRKYRRLKPFLFITVVIMVNVYSTLNFRGPPTPPFFFLSWVINQFVALTRLRLNLHHWSRFQWSPSLLSNQVEEPICQIHCMKVLFMPKVHFLKFIE